MVLVNWWHMDS